MNMKILKGKKRQFVERSYTRQEYRKISPRQSGTLPKKHIQGENFLSPH